VTQQAAMGGSDSELAATWRAHAQPTWPYHHHVIGCHLIQELRKRGLWMRVYDVASEARVPRDEGMSTRLSRNKSELWC
jgi:hypothetical protein